MNGSEMPPDATILVVDDHSDLRDVIALLLEDSGFHVADASNGLEAVAYLHSGRPAHAIILDLDMPVMNGWDFLVEWRNHPKWSSIPTLVLTGVSDAERRSHELTGTIVFTKPFNFDRLVDAIRRMMIRPVITG